jgi:hypothetical protein
VFSAAKSFGDGHQAASWLTWPSTIMPPYAAVPFPVHNRERVGEHLGQRRRQWGVWLPSTTASVSAMTPPFQMALIRSARHFGGMRMPPSTRMVSAFM